MRKESVNIKQYIDSGLDTLESLGKKLKHSKVTVWRWYHGGNIKMSDLAKLPRVTDGHVTPTDCITAFTKSAKKK